MHLQIVAHNQHELSTVVYAWCNWINNPPPYPLASNKQCCLFFPNPNRGHTHGTSTFSKPRALPRSRGLKTCTKKYPTHSPTPRHGENTGLPATQISDSK